MPVVADQTEESIAICNEDAVMSVDILFVKNVYK